VIITVTVTIGCRGLLPAPATSGEDTRWRRRCTTRSCWWSPIHLRVGERKRSTISCRGSSKSRSSFGHWKKVHVACVRVENIGVAY